MHAKINNLIDHDEDLHQWALGKDRQLETVYFTVSEFWIKSRNKKILCRRILRNSSAQNSLLNVIKEVIDNLAVELL